jgi:hypothetical protein
MASRVPCNAQAGGKKSTTTPPKKILCWDCGKPAHKKGHHGCTQVGKLLHKPGDKKNFLPAPKGPRVPPADAPKTGEPETRTYANGFVGKYCSKCMHWRHGKKAHTTVEHKVGARHSRLASENLAMTGNLIGAIDALPPTIEAVENNSDVSEIPLSTAIPAALTVANIEDELTKFFEWCFDSDTQIAALICNALLRSTRPVAGEVIVAPGTQPEQA